MVSIKLCGRPGDGMLTAKEQAQRRQGAIFALEALDQRGQRENVEEGVEEVEVHEGIRRQSVRSCEGDLIRDEGAPGPDVPYRLHAQNPEQSKDCDDPARE
jgi:hypothetical protein